MLRFIHNQDTKGILDLIDRMMREGRELNQFVTDFMWYLRNLLLVKTCSGSEDTLDMSTENRRLLEEEAAFMEEEVIMRYIRVISELLNQMRYSTQKRVLMEVGFLKLAKPQMETDTSSLLQRIMQLEEKMEKGVFVQEAKGIKTPNTADMDTPIEEIQIMEIIEKQYEPATAEEVKKIASNWRNLTASLTGPMKTYLLKAIVNPREDGKGLRLMFPDDADGAMAKGYFDRENHRDDLKEKIASITSKVLEIETGLLSREETPTKNMLDLSKIKMPITFE